MSDNPPPVGMAVESREEMIRDLADRHGVSPEDYQGHLEDLGLNELHDQIELIDLDEADRLRRQE